jgi:Collagen triple helix repeat (20 copies)
LLRGHAVAFTALFLVVGSAAYASADQGGTSPAPKKTYACVAGEHRTLNLTSAGHACPNSQEKIAVGGATGPRGPRGKAGAPGKPGAKGTAGTAGPKGADGAKGDVGATGAAGATGPAGPKGADGATGPQGTPGTPGAPGPAGQAAPVEYAEFFALMPPDNAATVPPGGAVDFPQDAPAHGDIARLGADTFDLPETGTYRVAFDVPVTEAGQLVLTLDGVEIPYTVAGRATGTSQITGESFVQTTGDHSVLSVANPASNSTALTITPLAGGTVPASATLTIELLRAGS